MDLLTDPFLISKERFDGPVLVTGAGGCIGSWALAILHRSGVPVVAADLSEDRRRAALVMGNEDANALTWETSDITDAKALNDIVARHKVRAIIHLAGLQVPFCAANPALGARVNVEGTINVLQCAREHQIKRVALASSVAALAFPEGGPWKETLYGAYKKANEQTAFVYWQDWQVPSVCIRPNVVYGVARDQGMSSKTTIGIQAAAMGQAYEVPFSGRQSWLYAGEAAAAFIAVVSQDGDGAYAFDLNGTCAKVEEGLDVLHKIAPDAQITCTGASFPFPPDLDDAPLRAHVPDYPEISLQDGVKATYSAFVQLNNEGRLPDLPE